MTDTTQSQPLVNVAIGILHREDGYILMAERPADKPSGGRWEFPGGKIEPDENPHQALARELREEIGIELVTAQVWTTKEHAYATLTARLHIFRVTDWHGEPYGREGQRLSWQKPDAVTVEPLLTVNHDIIKSFLATVWTTPKTTNQPTRRQFAR